MVTPLKTLMGFSVHLNVQLKFYNLPFRKNFANRVSKIALIFKKSILIIVFNSIIGNYDVGYPTEIVCLNCLFRFASRFAGSTPAVVIGVMPK